VIERRHNLIKSDTLFYNLTNVRAQNYRMVFIANNLSAYGLDGFIEDTYLHTKIPLNLEGTTKVDFNVTSAAGSYAINRFRIVFAPLCFITCNLRFLKSVPHKCGYSGRMESGK